MVVTEEGVPTSVDFVHCEPNQMVASYTTSNTYIYDIETSKEIACLESKSVSGKGDLTWNIRSGICEMTPKLVFLHKILASITNRQGSQILRAD